MGPPFLLKGMVVPIVPRPSPLRRVGTVSSPRLPRGELLRPTRLFLVETSADAEI